MVGELAGIPSAAFIVVIFLLNQIPARWNLDHFLAVDIIVPGKSAIIVVYLIEVVPIGAQAGIIRINREVPRAV